MSDEAREAARRAVPFHANRGFSIIREGERRDGFALGFDAGVAEGIRQAREQLEQWKADAPPPGHVWYSEALRAIDALGEENGHG